MFQDNSQDAGASNVPPADNAPPDYEFDTVRHTLFGTLHGVQNTIKLLTLPVGTQWSIDGKIPPFPNIVAMAGFYAVFS